MLNKFNKNKRQRAKRGWSDSDAWDLSFYVARIISEATAHLVKHSYGYPPDLTREGWLAILNKISIDFGEFAEHGTDIPDSTWTVFTTYFKDLWD